MEQDKSNIFIDAIFYAFLAILNVFRRASPDCLFG